ncbi:alpha/beta hydrolase [Terrarubrum flagellatum]|uniref:alpha/beta hydrolase n=1 Tax=Terrirubrum flagellatum TaxID=2895980 RepID=UPI0031450AE9
MMPAISGLGHRRRAYLAPALAATLIAAMAGGCVSRPDSSALNPVAAVADARTVGVFVATSRGREEAGRNVFTSARAPAANFARFVVSIPPNHTPSMVEWPMQRPADPSQSFAVTDQSALDRPNFLAQLDKAAATTRGEVVIFVHGYNMSFEEALFRFAQVQHDSGLAITPVLFAWPSKADLMGYVADRESAAYSRDYLESVLSDVNRLPHVRKVILAAHSMGCWLAMEALRQSRLNGGAGVSKLGDVVLAAPDIDIDVFRSQLEAIGKLREPITVLASPDDQALAFSRRIGGDVDRVGAVSVEDPRVRETARRYGVRIIDISSSASDTPLNHNRYVTSVPVLAQIAASGGRGRGIVLDAGTYVLDSAARTLLLK